MSTIYSTSAPALLDRALYSLQTHMADKLPWLAHLYGKVQKLATLEEGREFYYPGVYISAKGEYESMFPDDLKKAFSFFIVHDPQVVLPHRNRADVKVKTSLIVWYDIKWIYPGTTEYNTESVKEEILSCLTNTLLAPGVSVIVDEIVESPENVYREYSFSQIKTQYSMSPFGCLRFNLTLNFVDVCL